MTSGEIILLFILLAREGFYQFQIKALLDRAMSRSFHEYQVAKKIGAEPITRTPPPGLQDEDKEDFGYLAGLG